MTFSVISLAQGSYYYGKNKIRTRRFNWKVLQTKNFDVHYYTENLKLIKKIARVAEDAYQMLTRYLGVKKKNRIPIIFYRNHIEFEQTNLGNITLGVEGAAEPTMNRIFVHGDRSFSEIRRTLVHELGHVFEFFILYQNVRRGSFRMRRPPTWVMEGFSEFVTQNWDTYFDMTVRDLVLNDLLPQLTNNLSFRGPNLGARTTYYDIAHLIYDFIYDKYGDIGIRRLFKSLLGGGVFSSNRRFFKLFNSTAKTFNYDLRRYAQNKFKKFEDRENPEDYGIMIGPDMPYYFTFSHEISPTGEMLAILTANLRNGEFDVVLISAKDGKVIKNITPGFSVKEYGQIFLSEWNPTSGSKISWDKDSQKIAFFARKDLTNYIVLVDITTNKIVKMVKLPKIHDPSSIRFHPVKDEIYFTSIENSNSFLNRVNLKTNKISKISNGSLFIRSFDISPDGKHIISSVKKDKYFKLVYAPLFSPDSGKQITFGKHNDITPGFSLDGKKIFYSSDELTAYNIYSYDLENNERNRYSNVQTGNFFPVQIPNDPDNVIIASFYKQRFSLFKKSLKDVQEKVVKKPMNVETDVDLDEQKTMNPKLEEQIRKSNALRLGDQANRQNYLKTSIQDTDLNFVIKDYKPLSRLVLNTIPSIGIGYSSMGRFMGSSYLNISDIMGDHVFTVYAATIYGYSSYQVAYLNLRRAIQWYTRFSYMTYSYYFRDYTDMTINTLVARKNWGLDTGFYIPLNRNHRLQLGIGMKRQDENYDELFMNTSLPYSNFANGFMAPITFAITGETTVFTYFGPLFGHTFHFSYMNYLNLGSKFIRGYTLNADMRKYFRLGNQSLLAFRMFGFYSDGKNPILNWTGGNNTIRSVGFRSMVGTRGFTINAEYRFPLMGRAPSIIGYLGPIRGVIFFDTGATWMNDSTFQFFRRGKFRLKDGIASYGIGLEMFVMGYPIHIEWVHQTDFQAKKSRGVKFWIGYDF
jgi:Tol biopolymer transport system component